jgi:hypothetical protein
MKKKQVVIVEVKNGRINQDQIERNAKEKEQQK